MLREIKEVSQVPNEPFRRWFNSNTMELFVWIEDSGEVYGFQLCYDKGDKEKALTWLPDRGYSHHCVDDGETTIQHFKMSPILVPDGVFPRDEVLALFKERSGDVDDDIVEFVAEKLKEYSG